ncbi:MAG: hypothetical protein ABI585_14300 [Betaproteobacteria bacterium]
MITIEVFLVLAAIVVLIGLVVWQRDLRSGRILRPKSLMRARSVRDLFVDTHSPAMGGTTTPVGGGTRQPEAADEDDDGHDGTDGSLGSGKRPGV